MKERKARNVERLVGPYFKRAKTMGSKRAKPIGSKTSRLWTSAPGDFGAGGFSAGDFGAWGLWRWGLRRLGTLALGTLAPGDFGAVDFSKILGSGGSQKDDKTPQNNPQNGRWRTPQTIPQTHKNILKSYSEAGRS